MLESTKQLPISKPADPLCASKVRLVSAAFAVAASLTDKLNSENEIDRPDLTYVKDVHPCSSYLGFMLDEEFFKERARLIRELAEKADPVTKQRLIDLLTRYEPRNTHVPSVTIDGKG